jgi:hypothetical protein
MNIMTTDGCKAAMDSRSQPVPRTVVKAAVREKLISLFLSDVLHNSPTLQEKWRLKMGEDLYFLSLFSWWCLKVLSDILITGLYS